MSKVVRFPEKEKKSAHTSLFRQHPERTYAELAVTTNFSFLRGASIRKN